MVLEIDTLNGIGSRFKIVRGKLKQEDFAEVVGFKRSYVSQVETEGIKPSLEYLVSVANSFNVSIDWLLLGTSDVNNADNQEGVILNIEDIQDKELNDILQEIKLFWKQSTYDVRIWFKVQFRRTFPEVEEAQKKQRGAVSGTTNGA